MVSKNLDTIFFKFIEKMKNIDFTLMIFQIIILTPN
jgi:hypothetical protein